MPNERDQGERLAALEQHVTDLTRRIDDHIDDADKRSDRMRELEAAVGLLVQAQKQARAAEAAQYRRLEVRIAWLTLAVLAATMITSLIVTFVHHG